MLDLDPLRPSHRPCLLVADDEPVIREIVRTMAESAGFEVATCCDAREALCVADRLGSALDAVLLDLHMPGMHPGVVTALAARAPSVRIMLMTGDIASATHGFACHGLLCKPFTGAELRSALTPAWQVAA